MARGLGSISIVVGDSNPHLADVIRSTFSEQGLTNVVVCTNGAAFEQAIDGKMIDLIVVEHVLPGIEFVDLIQRIRRNRLGRNPFVTVIATLGKIEPGSTKAMMDAGVDDIVPKPLSAENLFKRVTTLAQKREPFVIAPNYVGPSRRTTEREGDNRPKIRDVPNTLRARMIDMAGDREVERMVERAAAQMSDDHFAASVMEIDKIVTRVVAFYETKGDPEDRTKDLQRLILVADAWRNTYDGPSNDVVTNLSGMIMTLARRIRDSDPEHKIVEVELLVQLSQAVGGSVDIDLREARHFDEITRIITKFTGQK
ncbi:MAG TPA: response regulator [Magnetospirillaceae bacterium]|jgi:DNA-binding response OmpR family regulator